jgi:hypothetical protein
MSGDREQRVQQVRAEIRTVMETAIGVAAVAVASSNEAPRLSDRTRRFNRTENVRPIPPSDPDFAHLYARRNDAESINRSLEGTLFPRQSP